MDLQDANKNDYQEQGPKKGIVIIVITILLGTNGLLLWQFFDKKNRLDIANQQVMTTTAEKDALQMQLNQFKNDYEKLKTENSGLQNQLSEKDEQIKAKVNEIQKLILLGGPAQIARAKAELAKLKEMNEVFVVQIDSLNRVTAELKQQNETLSTTLNQEKSKNENLSAENNRLYSKIKAGSILKAINIVTEGIRLKGQKESVTNKSKQVQSMRTKFVLSENRVIDGGQVDIYLRVLGPDGTVETSGQNYTFEAGGKILQYTAKQSVDYNNSDTNVEVNWARGTGFQKGKYNVEIYQSGILIGNSTIDLR